MKKSNIVDVQEIPSGATSSLFDAATACIFCSRFKCLEDKYSSQASFNDAISMAIDCIEEQYEGSETAKLFCDFIRDLRCSCLECKCGKPIKGKEVREIFRKIFSQPNKKVKKSGDLKTIPGKVLTLAKRSR